MTTTTRFLWSNNFMVTFTLRAAPLPVDFVGTPQQLFDAMLDRMEVVSDVATFVVQDSDPGTNQGPWLKEGTKWYVWSTATNPAGEYVPLDITDSVQDEVIVAKEDPNNAGKPYGISNYADMVPPHTPPRIWLQTDAGGTQVLAVWYNFGGNVGWTKGPSVLTTLETSKLVPPSDRAKHLLVVSDDGNSITTREASIAQVGEPEITDANKVVAVKADGSGFELKAPAVAADPTVSFTDDADVSTGGSLEELHGLGYTPKWKQAVLVCTADDAGYVTNDEIPLECCVSSTSSDNPYYRLHVNATTVKASVRSDVGLRVVNGGASTNYVTLNKTKWKLKVYVR